MNAPARLEIIEQPSNVRAIATTPADLLSMAVQQGADLDKLERLMALQERWEASQAKKAYNEAFSAFKAEAVRIIKNRSVTAGPLIGKKYAELFAVVNAITPALSAHGLSAAWSITKDDKDWLEVTCTLKHVGGHTESVSMGGPPDAGGAKNAIQARASTVSYLERYTLKAITGLSEQDDDKDGGGKGNETSEADAAALVKLRAAAQKGEKALQAEFQASAISDAGWQAHRGPLVAEAKQVDKLAGRA